MRRGHRAGQRVGPVGGQVGEDVGVIPLAASCVDDICPTEHVPQEPAWETVGAPRKGIGVRRHALITVNTARRAS
jgi:hypothetical protein